jgi:hypothetical protein
MVRRILAGVLVTGALIGVQACNNEEPHPVRVGTDRVTVINLTDTAWRDVDVWLNDHYRVQQRDLAPGQRLEIPLGVFVAAFGQKFDPKKQVPSGIEVDAVAADGKPVKIVWGKGRRR